MVPVSKRSETSVFGIHKNVATRETTGMKRFWISTPILLLASVFASAQNAQKAAEKKQSMSGELFPRRRAPVQNKPSAVRESISPASPSNHQSSSMTKYPALGGARQCGATCTRLRAREGVTPCPLPAGREHA